MQVHTQNLPASLELNNVLVNNSSGTNFIEMSQSDNYNIKYNLCFDIFNCDYLQI